MSKGNVYLISGPSGSGKDTVLCEIFKKCPDLAFSISSITRDMRAGEIEGEKYNFISKEKFLSMLKNDELLEHNVFVGNYYGTPKAPVLDAIKNGRDIIIEVDVNGAKQIRENLDDTVSIFIMPPSLTVLKQRLTGRGTETKEAINKRISAALEEIARADEYDYIVINDKLSVAVDFCVSIIKSGLKKTENKRELIENILNK